MFSERIGLIVWISDVKAAKNQLERFGSVHYISRKMHYAVLYIHANKEEETSKQLQRLHWVRRIERSYRNEIKTDYNSNMPDKTRFYSL